MDRGKLGLQKIMFFNIDILKEEMVSFNAMLTTFNPKRNKFNIIDKINIVIEHEHENKDASLFGTEENTVSKTKASKLIVDRFHAWADVKNEKEKILIAGYNISIFDLIVLKDFLKENSSGDFKYFSDWFYRGVFDVYNQVLTNYVLFSNFYKFPTKEIIDEENNNINKKMVVSFDMLEICKHWGILYSDMEKNEAKNLITIKIAERSFDMLKKRMGE